MNPTIAEIRDADHPGTVIGDALANTLSNEVAFLNARTAALAARSANAALAPLGLRVRSYAVLSVASGSTPPSQRQLAAYLQLDPSQIVSLVDDLEKSGLVRRELDPSDRRVNVIVATDQGKALCARAARLAAAAEDRSLRALEPAERIQLIAILRKVAFADLE